jgi:thermitase
MPPIVLALLLNLALLAGHMPAAPSDSPLPDDPEFPSQWALERVGALCAWEHGQGSPDVTVAVVDSGVDLGHPDLVGRLRGDGFDFVDGDAEPRDENGHGTNVAGVIAATAGNAEGIAGLAPAVQLLPVRVMDAQGYGSERLIAEGVRYAVDRGARVINLSVGVSLLLAEDVASQPVADAIAYAGAQGALVVVAAGNDYAPVPNALAVDAPHVLVVAASDEEDRRASFSNFGPWVDVVAPGVSILSTMPTYEVYLTRAELPPDRRFQQGYDYMSGTSQAAPHVAGLAALLFAQHPEWTPEQVAALIRASAADIADTNPELVGQPGFASGRMDACAALGDAGAPAPVVAAARVVPNRAPLNPTLVALLAAALSIAVGLVPLLRPRRVRWGGATAVFQPAAVSPSAAVPGVGLSPSFKPARRAATGTTARMVAWPQARRQAWGVLRVVAGPGERRVYPLYGHALLLGRGSTCDLIVSGDPAVSRQHLRLRRGAQLGVEDLGATHGSYLNGRRIAGFAALHHGDLLHVGETTLQLEIAE